MSGFDRTEKIILGFAMSVLIVFSYFLYDDSFLFPKSDNNKLELIGNVTLSQNDVRRKNLDTFSWLPASEKDKVFQNDSIFTGERSEALIRLQDGTQIKIQSNSLITLNLKNGQMNLNLRYGNLVGELAKNSSLTIKSGNEEFKLENTPNSPENSKIQFKKNHNDTTDFKLLSGNAKFTDKKKNKLKELKKNTEVSVSKEGDLKTLEKPVLTLITADNTEFLRINPDDPIPLAWKSEGPVASYELEVSDSEDFNSALLKKSTSETKVEIKDPLKSGTYFWRLKALDKNGDIAVTSSVHNIRLSELASPQITTPIKNAQVHLELKVKPKETLTTSMEVQWTANSQLKNFTWQISQDSAFENILKEGQTGSLSILIPKLLSGTYWVRVQGQTETQKKSPWSEGVPFTLNLFTHKETAPSRPILITKSIKFKVPSSSNNRKPTSADYPKIEWKPVLQSKNYHIQISQDIQFKETEKLDATNTQVAWSQYLPGKYYFRVYARGVNDLLSEPSETGTLDVSVGNLTLTPVKPITINAGKPKPVETPVSWNDVAFAKKYLLQIDKNKDFSQASQFEFTSNKGAVTLPDPGSYHIRVQALDDSNKPLTEFSNSEEALYIFNPPLTSPSLLEPFHNASIFLQTEMEPFIWLEWKNVARAEVYSIEISDKPDFSRILISTTVKGTRYLIKDKVPLGKIYWRVQAASKSTSEYSEWTNAHEFTLYHQKNEGFVQ